MNRPTRNKLHNDQRGAVLVEFVVAFMPLMITFSCFVQLAQLATAKVVVKHSAIVAARGAAVITNKNKNTPGQEIGDNKEQIVSAAKAALGPWSKTMKSVEVEIEDKSDCSDDGQYGLVSVTVTAEYKCSVPFGGRLLCGAVGATRTLKQTYGFPHQGARYKTEGADCGGGE